MMDEISNKRLAELLELSKKLPPMTAEQREAQRQSWARGEMGIGNDRAEAEARRKWREENDTIG